ncbi:methyltransferase domain-containing protein [Aureococcus anophagefferens]|nr:methyltransferase domain-containing protein [Aureococcus anophagefferens]
MAGLLGILAVLASARAQKAVRLINLTLGEAHREWGQFFVERMPRRCATYDEGSTLMAIGSDHFVYELTTCDDILQAGSSAPPAERAKRTVAAMEDTVEFNTLAATGRLRFRDDFVTSNWHLAWVVDELTRGGAPARALEIGSYEGRSAWLWYRLLSRAPGSTLTCVDIQFAEHFEYNVEPLRTVGFLERTLEKPSNRALFELDPDRPYDLIYVDGSHNATHVLADVVMADVLLRDGGLMILDDIEWRGVTDAAERFFEINRDRYAGDRAARYQDIERTAASWDGSAIERGAERARLAGTAG